MPLLPRPPRTVRDAVGLAHVGGDAVPSPTSQDAGFPIRRPMRVNRQTIALITVLEPIRSPFPNVPKHVVKLESVRRFLPYRPWSIAICYQTVAVVLPFLLEYISRGELSIPRIIRIPSDILQRPIPRPGRSAPRGVFPFGFGR